MKPTIEVLERKGHRIRWIRGFDGVIYTETNHRSRSKKEAWTEAKRFFRLVGCTEEPELG